MPRIDPDGPPWLTSSLDPETPYYLTSTERAEFDEMRKTYPLLLDALKTLAAEEWRDDGDPVLDAARSQARAVIAKAEGATK